jgi:HAD superfamily hydrolase (TIGR01509 family)
MLGAKAEQVSGEDMPRTIQGAIFDMDGTLTVPVLDFTRMKAEIGVAQDVGLLESMATMSAPERAAAEVILLRHELAAAAESVLNDGVKAALAEIAAMGLKTAILTRNCAESVRIVLARHGLRFDTIVSREDSKPKPDPDGVHVAARRIGIDPSACIVVGDYEFDIQAGKRAGSVTVLFSPTGRTFATVPDFQIRSMSELPPLVRSLG